MNVCPIRLAFFETADLLRLIPFFLIFFSVLGVVPLLVFCERKICAWIQNRSGPNRVGLLGPDGLLEGILGIRVTRARILGGLLQPLADALKLLTKEDFVPARCDRFLYGIAPFFALLPPLLAFAVIPAGSGLTWNGQPIPLQVSDLGIGVLWVLSVASLSAYGVALGGWAANNKYSLLGGVRATAQMISYEIGMGLAILAAIMHYETVSLREMAEQQAQGCWAYGLFHQPVAFLIFFICAFAENNRLPFDMPEADAELVGGYHTEYGALKFGMFMQGEYIAMLAMGALIATLFLGGWHFPFWAQVREAYGPNLAGILSLFAFALKTLAYVFFSIWVRWTLPRFRYDQVMALGWKVLIPVGLANLLWTAWANLPG